jgi:hypothetical protein
MRLAIRRAAGVLMGFILLAGSLLRADAAPVEPSDANAITMMEATVEGLSILGLLVGPDPENSLNWTGTFNDAGWNWSLSGTYQGEVLELNYSGVYDPNILIDDGIPGVIWKGSGKFGKGSITAEGRVILIDDWSWGSVFIAGVAIVADAVIVGTEVFTPGGQALAAASVKAVTIVTTTAIGGIVTVEVLDEVEVSKDSSGATNMLTAESVSTPTTPVLPSRTPIGVVSTGEVMGNSVTGQATVNAVPEDPNLPPFRR